MLKCGWVFRVFGATHEEGWGKGMADTTSACANTKLRQIVFFRAPIVDHVQFNVGISGSLFPPELGKEKGNLDA